MQPFFIVGCPRSGTTLLSVLLDRHSEIAVTPETAFYDDIAGRAWPDDPDMLRDMLAQWPRLPELGLDADVVVASCPIAPTPAEVFATILALYAEASNKTRCGEKTPQHLNHAERILADFPHSPVFCLLRDGRDTALSLAAMPWWASDLVGAARCWLDAVGRARSLSAAYPERFMIIRYEYLVTEPADTLGKILTHLSLSFEPQQLVATGDTHVILPRSRAWKGNASLPVNSNQLGSRQANASREDAMLLEGILGATLVSLGYDVAMLDKSPSEAVDPLFDPSTDSGGPASVVPTVPLLEASLPSQGAATIITGARVHQSRLDRGWQPDHSRPAAKPPRRLTVSILTRDSASRLGRLIDEVSCFADEIVVGVDAASTDETLAVASDLADKVYRFAHPPGQLSASRMLIFRYASGDWILSLDDDESISDSFDGILPELLDDAATTNFWFRRQWIVDRASFAYPRKPPWYPDWQLRMFRNDASRVWKPAHAHSGYHVQGQSRLEPRVAIHHFEPLLLDGEARSRKLAAYREAGSSDESEKQYVLIADETPQAVGTPRRGTAPRLRGQSYAVVDRGIHTPEICNTAPWGSRILDVDLSPPFKAGDAFAAEVWARNTGLQAWTPHNLSLRGPLLSLSYHVLTAEGEVIKWDNTRCPIPKLARPGEDVMIIFCDVAPHDPGRYIFEWDFVSDGETWFSAIGAPTYRTFVDIV